MSEENINQIFAYAKSLPSKIPTVEIKGWWWKKYFKKYQTQKMIMQGMINKHGVHIVDEAMRMMIDQIKYGSKLPPIIDNEGKAMSFKIYKPRSIK